MLESSIVGTGNWVGIRDDLLRWATEVELRFSLNPDALIVDQAPRNFNFLAA
jgi:hypothetical protein